MPSPIAVHLWFDRQAVEAATFYANLFPDSGVDHVVTLRNTPSGDCDLVNFHLGGRDFMAISAGPLFQINPSISFLLNFDPTNDPEALAHLDATWTALAQGGTALMPLQAYPFSRRFGWIRDRFGVTWQLRLTEPGSARRPFLVPCLMFTGPNAGRAQQAIAHYTDLFPESRQATMKVRPVGTGPDEDGSLVLGEFVLLGQWFAAMDSAQAHGFTFNEAVSLLVRCKDQAEIDRYWSDLSAVPEAEQCGWLKDQFGVSWQVAPAEMDTMLRHGTPEQLDCLTKAFLPMQRFDLEALRRAYRGEGPAPELAKPRQPR